MPPATNACSWLPSHRGSTRHHKGFLGTSSSATLSTSVVCCVEASCGDGVCSFEISPLSARCRNATGFSTPISAANTSASSAPTHDIAGGTSTEEHRTDLRASIAPRPRDAARSHERSLQPVGLAGCSRCSPGRKPSSRVERLVDGRNCRRNLGARSPAEILDLHEAAAFPFVWARSGRVSSTRGDASRG